MVSLEQTKAILKKYHFRPERSRGQNFLIDDAVLKKIIKVADLKPEDLVLEIGPGLGVLTRELAGRVKKVFSVEIDQKLVRILKSELRDYQNLEIINQDILKLAPKKLGLEDQRYQIVANLPYNITSLVLRKFLELAPRPKTLTILVQKEVAERICAGPGEMSLLSLAVQFYGEPELVWVIPRKNFWPEPGVDSALVKIKTLTQEQIDQRLVLGMNEKDFFRVARIGFSSRRKQLQNNLAAGLDLTKVEIKNFLEELSLNPLARAQDLSLADWSRLTRKLKSVSQKF